MSLQVWLPLNGDLRNQGCSNPNISLVSGNTWASSGKIGNNSLTLTKLQTILPTSSCMTGAKEVSYCYWVKVNTAWSANWLDGIRWIETDGSATSTARQEFYTNCTLVGTWYKGGSIAGKAFTPGIWTHLAATFNYNTGEANFYIDGILKGATTNVDKTYYCRGDFYIGDNGVDICQNDVRIYDHCLSVAEVREISQGLVLHYKLDNFQGGYGNPNLITGYDTSFLSYPDGAVTLFYNQMNSGAQEIVSNIPNAEKCLHLHSNGGANRQYRVISVISGKSYTISVDYYSTYNQATPLHCELNGGNYSWTVADGQTYNTPGQWTRLSTTYTTLTSNATLYYFIKCSNGTDCYVKNFKIEEGVSATNWTPDNTAITVIEDSSGYNHNGTIVGTATLVSSPRYSFGTAMNNTSTANRIEYEGLPTETQTVSLWVKGDKSTSQVYFTDKNSTLQFGIYNSLGTTNISSKPLYNLDNFVSNEWNHIVVIKNSTNNKLYINGVAATTSSSSNYYAHSAKLYLFNRNTNNNYACNGAISDFRAYVTALTDDQIRQLYEVGAKIDNKANFHTYEINENGSNKLTKTGIMYDNMVESIMTLPDGSHWQLLMFHYVDNGHNLFTRDNAAYCNDFGLYSRLRDIDGFKLNNQYEFYVIQDDIEYRWTQTNAPATSTSPGTVTTVSGYNNPSVGLAKNGSNTYLGYNSWWGACGCWTLWNGNAIPGFGGRNCTKYLALYARIEKADIKLSNQTANVSEFIEL